MKTCFLGKRRKIFQNNWTCLLHAQVSHLWFVIFNLSIFFFQMSVKTVFKLFFFSSNLNVNFIIDIWNQYTQTSWLSVNQSLTFFLLPTHITFGLCQAKSYRHSIIWKMSRFNLPLYKCNKMSLTKKHKKKTHQKTTKQKFGFGMEGGHGGGAYLAKWIHLLVFSSHFAQETTYVCSLFPFLHMKTLQAKQIPATLFFHRKISK